MMKAMKRAIMLLSLAMLVTMSWARDKKLVKIKVEVVEQPEGVAGSVRPLGALGGAEGRKVFTDAWVVRVIINGEHAMLTCYETHNPCHFLGVGTLMGN
jgi:hypothetical protein